MDSNGIPWILGEQGRCFRIFTDLSGVTNAIFAGIPGREIKGCDLLGCTFCIIGGTGKAAEAAPSDRVCAESGGLLLPLALIQQS